MFCKNLCFYQKLRYVNTIGNCRHNIYTSCDLKNNRERTVRPKPFANPCINVTNCHRHDASRPARKYRCFSTTSSNDGHLAEASQNFPVTYDSYDAGASCHISGDAILARLARRNVSSHPSLQLSLHPFTATSTISMSGSSPTLQHDLFHRHLDNAVCDVCQYEAIKRKRLLSVKRHSTKRLAQQTTSLSGATRLNISLAAPLAFNDCVLTYSKLRPSEEICDDEEKQEETGDDKLSREKLDQLADYVIDEWKKIVGIGGELRMKTALDSSIYHPDIELVNKWFSRKYVKTGLTSYIWEMKKLQSLLTIKYDSASVQILSKVVNQHESSVKVRWRIVASKKSIIPLSSSSDKEVWMDGICLIYVNNDLYITKHIVEKFEKEKKSKINVLYKNRLAKVLGMAPADT